MTRRLPSLDPRLVGASRPLAPPPPQQQPSVLGVASSYEAVTVAAPWSRGRETSVYTTQRRWRACDVYIERPDDPGPLAFTLSIFVYAVAQGTRTLVASGRYRYNSGWPFQTQEFRKWIVAARASAERFEITTRVDQPIAAGTIAGKLVVTVVAADEMTEPPPLTGAMTTVNGSSNIVIYNGVGLVAPPVLEVVSVTGINTAVIPAPRYLLLYDTDVSAPAAIALLYPIRVWPMGSAAGGGVVDNDIRYRSVLAPLLAISSDPVTYTDPGDGSANMVVR